MEHLTDPGGLVAITQPFSQCDPTKYRRSQQEDSQAIVDAIENHRRKQIRCKEKCDRCKCGEADNPHPRSVA